MIGAVAAWPWSAVAAVRVGLYRNGWIRRVRLGPPVISVGALEMGGTGKTPATVAIARTLADAGLTPAILSRGYGREGQAPVLVSSGAEPGTGVDASRAGDEPWLMAHLLPEVPIAVAGRRELAAALLPSPGPGVIVLDDGFQHVRLERALDLVTIDHQRPFWTQFPPPVGRLREGARAARRADAFVTRSPDSVPPSWLSRPLLELVLEPPRLVPLATWVADPAASGIDPAGILCGAFAGIARPARFFRQLERDLGIRLAFAQQYRDHQSYTTPEIHELIGRASARGADLLLTTEKDAARLTHLDLDDAPIVVVTHRLALRRPESLLELLDAATGRGAS